MGAGRIKATIKNGLATAHPIKVGDTVAAVADLSKQTRPQRLLAVAHGAIGALKRSQRQLTQSQYNSGTLPRLTEAMAAWVRGNRLALARFADAFFDREPDDPIVQSLRDAALGAAMAATQAEEWRHNRRS